MTITYLTGEELMLITLASILEGSEFKLKNKKLGEERYWHLCKPLQMRTASYGEAKKMVRIMSRQGGTKWVKIDEEVEKILEMK